MTSAVCLLLVTTAAAQPGDSAAPHWLWSTGDRAAGQHMRLSRSFEVTDAATKADLFAAADGARVDVRLNGKAVARLEAFGPAPTIDVTPHLRTGENQLVIEAEGLAEHAAVCLRLTAKAPDGSRTVIATDRGWRIEEAGGGAASKPVSFGEVAAHRFAWRGDDRAVSPFEDYTQWKRAINAAGGADPATFHAAEGFEVELVRSAGADEGSWVSMAFDPAGRLIIAREDKGLLRFTLPKGAGDDLRVETINETLKECRGLAFVGRDLFVSANNDKALYRLRDTKPDDGRDRYDQVTKLLESPGGVGHGRNDLAIGKDGRVYAIRGDSVQLPQGFAEAPSPLRHAGIPRAAEGHVIAFDPRSNKADATWQLFCAGLRNPYGIAFNEDGEAFTYDADAEFDMGSSWYRPTRVRHLVSGADYGWRAVTRRWPPYDPDHPGNPPSNLDVGKGSPTGVKFGTKSNFPPPYREALFILDWTYGRVLAVHLTPRGASYLGRMDTFVQGRPLNVTDLDFGPDGAMYVVTGGRRTKSALYRVRYTGPPFETPPATRQEAARDNHAKAARAARRRLETYHGRRDARAVDAAWPYLDSPDPWLRQAARVAIEHQPVDSWRGRAMKEDRPTARLLTLNMLAAGLDGNDLAAVVDRLNQVDLAAATPSQMLLALHAYALCRKRGEGLAASTWATARDKLEPLYPDDAFLVNQRLSELLIQLGSQSAVGKTVRLLNHSGSQREQFHYLFVLRNAKEGWTDDLRLDYFRWLSRMNGFRGGQGLPTFVKKIRDEALTSAPADRRERLAAMLAPASAQASAAPPLRKTIVKKWKVSDLAGALTEVDRGRNFERGREMFAVAQCVRCHRMGSGGGVTGPDLTSLGARFSRRDMLEAIIEPSKVIAVNYRSVRVSTKDGQTVIGQVVMGGDYRSPHLEMTTNALEPGSVVKIAKADITSHETLPLSPMPTGLIDTLTRNEVLDLLAYLRAGGDQRHPVFTGKER